MEVLRRNLLPPKVVEPWIARLLSGAATPLDVRRPRPAPRQRQRRGVPARAATCSSPWARAHPRSAPTCCCVMRGCSASSRATRGHYLQHTEPTCQCRRMTDDITGHGGELAVAVARAHGVETMFTLSGAHVFPMYDGAVKADPPMQLLDVRHEQTAAFAAEATGKLTRVPGLAVLTAGPGVTNGISAITQAQFAGSPLVVVGGRAPHEPLGQRQPAGARPAADRRERHQARARPCTTAGDVLDGMRRRVRGGRLVAPRPGLRRRPDGRVLRVRVAARPRRCPRGRCRARPRRDRPDRRAAGRRLAPGARARHRRLGRRRRGRGAAARRVARPAGAHQRHGPRRDPRRSPVPDDQGPRCRARQGATWSSWSARRSTSASATASSAARRAVLPRADRAHRRLGRARSPATPPWPASVSGDLTKVFDGLLAAVERGARPRDRHSGRRGPPSSRTPSSSPRRRTPSC